MPFSFAAEQKKTEPRPAAGLAACVRTVLPGLLPAAALHAAKAGDLRVYHLKSSSCTQS
jgi:hypothetical protein